MPRKNLISAAPEDFWAREAAAKRDSARIAKAAESLILLSWLERYWMRTGDCPVGFDDEKNGFYAAISGPVEVFPKLIDALRDARLAEEAAEMLLKDLRDARKGAATPASSS